MGAACISPAHGALRSCGVKLCWKSSAFASCLHLLSVIFNLSITFFFPLPEILSCLLHLSKAFPTLLPRLLAVCLPVCSPPVGAAELVLCGQALTPACSPVKSAALSPGICICMAQISGVCEHCRECTASCLTCVKAGKRKKSMQHEVQ